ncbi:RagB/SusD family nutrient uptake outer membrane protein [Zhouia spongiae]|uniref:RagB/SusD family nutrient uptake outer membrane protein n=1 Tax=Zhouia spongiae TaxID=2202721 RepID=A0ABY3YIF8_9FLAO|nr:RagB/SusD family nutrient uptake outer membrane protein [Zhouia spongiae]UNY97475.1 RagB/SusD family nutrient uptake outer membrane protein [Zhouia spongiae]
MNKYKYKIFLTLIAIGFLSCEVDRIPETSISDPSFWNTESDLKAAANYMYTFLPGLPVTSDVWSDDATGRGTNGISDGSRLVPGSDGFYSSSYRLIRAANNIIEKSGLVVEKGISQEVVNIYVAEAKFFRAWAYFGLMQRYGGVPLILKTLNENAEELQAPQASREEVLDAIYEDLDFSGVNLQLPSQMNGSDFGRITKTTAWALKSRVALFEGTRSKFHGYGNPNQHLSLAKEAALKVINSNEHELLDSYYDLFQYEGDGPDNKENILVRIYGQSMDNIIVSHNSQRNLEQGAANPTKALADAYLMVDGLPIDVSPMYNTPQSIIEVFENRDPRMDYTFLKEGNEYIGTQPEFTIPALQFQVTGFANRRYISTEDWTNQRSFIDYAIIRYAEVLLNYAEASFELDDQISEADLNISINQLRKRPSVNMPDLTNTFVSSNGLNMREEIRRERRVELALEGFRYWDLIRWKTAEIELPKPILGNYYFAEFGSEVVPPTDENNYILFQSADTRSFDPNKDYLWPFATEEIALNPNLEQNPNW